MFAVLLGKCKNKLFKPRIDILQPLLLLYSVSKQFHSHECEPFPITMKFLLIVQTDSLTQGHWVYRTFEDIEDLERNRSADEKEESTFRPYPVENGSNVETNGTNGIGENQYSFC